MGLIDRIFKRLPQPRGKEEAWKAFTAYQPVFYTSRGELYERELVRASVDARARHIGKLGITTIGTAKPGLQSRLRSGPNEFQTYFQFLYRTSVILDMQGNAFIVPVLDEYGEISGIYSVLPSRCDLVSYEGEPWIRYRFSNNNVAALPLNEVGIMTRFQYRDDFFGEGSAAALRETAKLMDIQARGVEEAVKNSNSFRFLARISNFSHSEDISKERDRFTDFNLAADSSSPLLLFPNTYTDIQQIQMKSYTVDAEQQALIKNNVFDYFGVNEDIIQNKASGDALGAFYDGAVEPFAIQLEQVLSTMLFSTNERARGSTVIVNANRLQYMTTSEKIQIVQQMGDRGMLRVNEARELLNYPPIEGPAGDRIPIRGEYYDNNKDKGEN